MIKLFKTLFGHAPTATTAPKPVRFEQPTPEQLRRLQAEAESADAREAYARELGRMLGREGVAPAATDSRETWISAISHASDPADAVSWLEQIEDPGELERIATTARSTEARLAAVKRIQDPSRLAQVASVMREKDRGVYRYCQDVLKRAAAARERAERIAEGRERLNEILARRPLPAGQLYEIRRRIAELEEGSDLAECRALLQQASQREQEEAAAVRAIDADLAESKRLLRTLAGDHGADPAPLSDWRERADRLAGRLAAVPDWLAAAPVGVELSRCLDAIERRLGELEEDAQRFARCREFLSERVAAADDPELEQAWAALPKPASQSARRLLEAEWSARAAPPAATPPSAPPQPVRLDLDSFRQTLAALEEALERGASQEAFKLARRLESMAAGAALPRSLSKRQRAALARLRSLRDWARWSGAHARDHLIEAAAALLQDCDDIAELAEAVPRLRQEWKRLEAQSRATGEQWKRFDALLSEAYQPVLAERAARAARYAEACEAKAACLAEAEQWVAELPGEADPARAADVQRHWEGLRQRWRSLAPARQRDERRLRERWEALQAAADSWLQPWLQAEIDSRRRLIAAAHRLQLVGDLREAVAQAKSLQERWRSETGKIRIPRAQSQALWAEFRAALDAVFARRDAERAAVEASEREWLAAQQALLDQFEASLRESTDFHQIESALVRFSEDWERVVPETALPGERRDPLRRRATQLVREAENRLRQARSQRQRELLATIAAKAGWAEALEALTLSGTGTAEQREALRRSWEASMPLPAEIERHLAARFARATEVTPTILAEGLARRAELLIDLEILLDLQSPPELAELRTRHQLAFLQRGFHALREPAALLDRVVEFYATAATPDPAQSARLERIVAALGELMMDGQKTLHPSP